MNVQQMKNCRVVLENFQTPKAQSALSTELRNAILERNILTTRTSKKFVSALNGIEQTEADKKRNKFRLQAIKEILSSEKVYIKQLDTITNYFIRPIKEKNLLSNHDFMTLFGSVETIYNVNKELAAELKRNPNNVAGAFLKLGPYLKIYSVYAYDYKKALSILQEAQTSDAEFFKFLQDQESRPEVQCKLSALLITPIQRVPRYRLLLKQVLDATNPNDSDYKSLIASLQKVEQAALHINNLVEEQENTQQMLEIQRSLQNNQPAIIKPGRRFIKAGFLKKMAHARSHSYNRYFILMSDIIMYCKPLKDKATLPNSLKCSCILPLNKCKLYEMPNKGAFKLNCQDENLTFYHESAGEYDDWIRAIKNALKKYFDDRQTLRKDSSARRPLRKRNMFENQDMGLSPGKKMNKRKINDKEYEDVFRSTKNDSDDSDTETRLCFPRKTYKRSRPEDQSDYYQPRKVIKFSGDRKDSLYPLRREIDADNNYGTSIASNENKQIVSASRTNSELVAYGQLQNGHNRPINYNFTIKGFFTGIGNSVKRVFGFNSN